MNPVIAILMATNFVLGMGGIVALSSLILLKITPRTHVLERDASV